MQSIITYRLKHSITQKIKKSNIIMKPIYIYLTPFFPRPMNWRGGFSLDAVREIQQTGQYDVRVIVAGTSDEEYVYDGIDVVGFRHRLGVCEGFPSFYDSVNRRSFRACLVRMGLLASEDNGSSHQATMVPSGTSEQEPRMIVHVHTPSCAVYADEAKRLWPAAETRLQFHQSGRPLTFYCGRFGTVPILSSLQAHYYRKLIARMDRLVFVSRVQLRRYEANEGVVPETRVKINYNPVDTRLFHPGEKIAHEGLAIGCVANFFTWKHHLTLLRAFVRLLQTAHLKVPIRLRLVGTGPTFARCRAFVSENNLGGLVSFESEMPHRKLPRFYHSLDLFVLPSEGEAFGSVCAEARACGVRVIASTDSGFAETLSPEERQQCTCPPGDVKALSERMRWALGCLCQD